MGPLLPVFPMMPAGAVAILSRTLGSLLFFALPRRRRIALENVRRAYREELPPRETRRLARRAFVHAVRVALEFLQLPNHRGAMDSAVVVDDGPLMEAHAKGKGVLLLVSHLGNWEYGAARVPAVGLPAVMVARMPGSRLASAVTERIRREMGVEMVPRRRGMRGILRALRDRKVVLIALDQHAVRNAVTVEFFGRPAATSTVVALLALRHDIPVVPAFVWREKASFRGVYLPEVPITRTGNLERDIRENTQNFVRLIERYVRRHPEQWLWMHRRWRLD